MKNLLFNNRKITSGHHRGMTLVELLVVSAIMVILMSVSIPVLTPLAENRMNRESARGVQSALESARARAIRLGRPCGVALVPFHQSYKYSCITLEQMTAPPSYESTNLPSLQTGDMYQINGTGAYIPAANSTNAGFGLTRELIDSSNREFYLVHKFPISEVNNAFAKALGIEASYSLPKGYIVDLYHSYNGGTSLSSGYSFSKTKPPVIIFKPDGTVSLYVNGSERTSEDTSNQTGTIVLMVGEWGRMMDGSSTLAEDGKNNKQVYNTYWVVIRTKTGEIHCVRNTTGSAPLVSNTNIAGGN